VRKIFFLFLGAYMQQAVRADLFLQSLALSVARNEVGAQHPIQTVLKAEGITSSEFDDIKLNPTYQGYVAKYTKELTESGFSFEAKCRVLAEDMLPGFYHLGRDPDTPAPVRAKVMEQLVKWANLEPKNDISVGGNAGFSINIVLPGENSGETTTITAEIKPTAAAESEPEAIDGEFDEISDDAPIPALPFSQSEILAEFFNEEEDYEYAGEDVYE
jgi:hypothetical protein